MIKKNFYFFFLLKKFSVDGKYLISVDRNESIRINNYPNAYNIHSFCFGHSKYVSKLLTLTQIFFLSGASDGTLKIWEIGNPKEVTTFTFVIFFFLFSFFFFIFIFLNFFFFFFRMIILKKQSHH